MATQSLAQMIDQAGRRGRRAKNDPAVISRDLTEEDLLRMAEGGGAEEQPQLQQLRQSHHQLARVLVTGVSDIEASSITGYTATRISILRNDPSFAELLNHYASVKETAFEQAQIDIAQRLRAIGIDTLEVLHEKIINEPEKIDVKTLGIIAELTLDRIGHGKQSTQNVNHSFGVDDSTLALVRAAKDAPAQVSEENRKNLLMLAQRSSFNDTQGEEPAGGSGEGESLREESLAAADEDTPASGTIIDLPAVDIVLRRCD